MLNTRTSLFASVETFLIFKCQDILIFQQCINPYGIFVFHSWRLRFRWCQKLMRTWLNHPLRERLWRKQWEINWSWRCAGCTTSTETWEVRTILGEKRKYIILSSLCLWLIRRRVTSAIVYEQYNLKIFLNLWMKKSSYINEDIKEVPPVPAFVSRAFEFWFSLLSFVWCVTGLCSISLSSNQINDLGLISPPLSADSLCLRVATSTIMPLCFLVQQRTEKSWSMAACPDFRSTGSFQSFTAVFSLSCPFIFFILYVAQKTKSIDKVVSAYL